MGQTSFHLAFILKTDFRILVASLSLFLPAWLASAQAPGVISHQGKLTVNGTNFTGTAQFKFALVNGAGDTTFWSDNGSSVGGAAPADPAISLTVSHGIFSVNLGDPSVPNMTSAIPAGVFTNNGVYLRLWVNDGVDGWQQMAPDRQIDSVGYAMVANTVTGTVPAASLPSGVTVVSTLAQDSNLLSNGYRFLMTVAPPPWAAGSTTGAASARSGHSAIWDGQQLLIWGGNVGSSSPVYVNSGAMYDPVADQWQTMSPLNAPDARSGHTTVWTGSSMLIWGGVSTNGALGTGGAFEPSGQSWTALSTSNAPSARYGHVAVWTGSSMFVWGGQNNSGLLNDGALYDPVSNQWTTITTPGAPEGRTGATAVWAGDRVIVWGGNGNSGFLNDGGELLFSNGVPSQWIAMSVANAPEGRQMHTAVWTGTAMLVWGGSDGGALGDGGSFSVASNTWTTITTNNDPAARFSHAALWTGQEMLILDGNNGATDLASGSAYNPATGTWRPLTTLGSPLARTSPGAVWTGSQALLFGGTSAGAPVAALQSLTPQPAWYFYSKL